MNFQRHLRWTKHKYVIVSESGEISDDLCLRREGDMLLHLVRWRSLGSELTLGELR